MPSWFIKHGFRFLIVGLLSANTWSLSADQIMEKVDTVEDGDTAAARLLMVLVDKNGKQKKRQFTWQRRDEALDSKSRIEFESPQDLAGTGFIGWNWHEPGKSDDTWLCLPALRKCKRIANEGQSGAFLGSDFSFYDINGLNISDWDYRMLDENSVIDGSPAYLIEALPKQDDKKSVEKKSGYKKIKLWIRKDNFFIVKAHYSLNKANKEKQFKVKKLEKVNGVWTIKQQQMITTLRGNKIHATYIQLADIEYNNALAETMFSSSEFVRNW